jgi:alpha-L-fucosidase 2
MYHQKSLLLFSVLVFGLCRSVLGQLDSNILALNWKMLPQRWDEALPLGNGKIGTLIWQKGDNLRFSLDQAELWDLRPMAELHTPDFNYQWVKKQVLADNYLAVQKIGDHPYDREPAPSKIPGAALEIAIAEWGKIISASLNIKTATAEIEWANGTKMTSFVHASKTIGYIKFENLNDLPIELLAPKYQSEETTSNLGPVEGDNLVKLGYQQGNIVKKKQTFSYLQNGWGGFYYNVAVEYEKIGPRTFIIYWSISAHYKQKKAKKAKDILKTAEDFDLAIDEHKKWWEKFWSKSEISLPNKTLEKQWYLEMYKFGSVARADAPPISLQAIWTADNGRIPPWKGDFHHDLNTQLSYWPAYSANHLDLEMGYLNHLEENKETYRKYTLWFFGSSGLNVPGVSTLNGEEMGGWIQYALSPTVSAWLAQHYYLHWRYSMDTDFLKNKAYPWFKEVANHLIEITYLDKNGNRQLPLSSSPEINNNSKEAWFLENTNYDLALMRFLFSKSAELADVLQLKQEEEKYLKILREFSDYHLSEKMELKFSKDLPYHQSHRHFSHLMAIHPLGNISMENGSKDQQIIINSLKQLDEVGPSQWTGYSYAWQGNLKARAKDGDGAAAALLDFATAFCSINSFHLNGDQTQSGKSNFTYRPFTLEGNFAFAAGIQEMLLQSYAGFIEVFPAVPESWQTLSFKTLRTEGAFLVSAEKTEGHTDKIEIYAEKSGETLLKLPFKTYYIENQQDAQFQYLEGDFLKLSFKNGGKIIIRNGYE